MTRTKIDLAIIFALILLGGVFWFLIKVYSTEKTFKQEHDIRVTQKDLPVLPSKNSRQNLFLTSELADWEMLKNLPVKAQEKGTVRVPILLYHHIEPLASGGNQSYYVSPQTFERQMKWLYNNDYEVVSLSRLTNYLQTGENPPPKKSVVITFDDGTQGEFDNAFPILQKFNFPATFYVVKEWLDKGEANQAKDYFGWTEAKQLLKTGMEIGSHSIDHKDLASLTDEESRTEIFNSKELIEQKLDISISSYAYASGSMLPRDWVLMEEAKYDSALSVQKGIDHKLSDIYHLDRMHIDNDLPYFIARIEGKYSK